LINQRRTCMRWDTVQYLCISHRSMGLKIAYPLSLSCTMFKADLVKLYPTFSSNFWCIWRSYFLWIKPNKSSDTHWTHPKTHHTLKYVELRWISCWTSTFWWRTQQHSDVHPGKHNNILMVRMFTQIFKYKYVGPMTHGITPLDTLQWLYEPKNFINRDQRLSITCTIAKHTRKQLKLFEALAFKLIITEDSFYPLSSLNKFSLLCLLKITSSSSSSIWFSNIRISHKL